MARKPRERSITGIYHVMLRGADRRIIFADEEDNRTFLRILRWAKRKSGFKLYAYCLMDNHVHFLMEEWPEMPGDAIKRLGVPYVHYYNQKYELHGHLFQDRFKSEKVENDRYFMDVLRYICQNPVKAGLCSTPFDYPWLGCSGVTKDPLLMDNLGPYTDMDCAELLHFVNGPCTDKHLDENTYKRLSDREAIGVICKVCGCSNVQEIAGWDRKRQEDAIRRARAAGVSIRQLSRLSSISKSVIERV